MKNKFLMSLLLGLGLFFLASGSLKASPITFGEVPLYTLDPLISGVQFFAGDPGSGFSDTIIDDFGAPVPGDAYLLSGLDDHPTASTGEFYDTFIGASGTAGLVFDSVTLDIASDFPPFDPTKFILKAVSGGAIVATSDTGPITDAAYHPLSISHADGFDTVWISGEIGSFGIAEAFRIDNFGWTEFTDPGGNGNGTDPIPEPTTVLLVGMGLGGLGLTALRRRRKGKNLQENS